MMELRRSLAERKGRILADLTTGSNIAGTSPLQANDNISGRGVQLFGSGFILTPRRLRLGLGRIAGLERHIRPYRNGRDLTATPRNVMVIDSVWADRRRSPSAFPCGVPVGLRAGQAGTGSEQPRQPPQ